MKRKDLRVTADKVRRVVHSCKTVEQLCTAYSMVINFGYMTRFGSAWEELDKEVLKLLHSRFNNEDREIFYSYGIAA